MDEEDLKRVLEKLGTESPSDGEDIGLNVTLNVVHRDKDGNVKEKRTIPVKEVKK